MIKPAPIVLIVFNRPNHTRRVIEALLQNPLAAKSVLYAFSDAPRGAQDEVAVGQVREILHHTKGFKKMITIERTYNMGCSTSVLTAISEVLSLHDRCIIVEDDVQPYSLFLQYMNEALELYKDDATIFSIGAYTHPFKLPNSYSEETFLLNRSCSWGWGTWKNAWEMISLDPDELTKGLSNANTRALFSRSGEDLLRTYKKTPDIWDLRVCFQQCKLGLNTLFPVQSMVQNIGRDGSGVHYTRGAIHSTDNDNAPSRLPTLNNLVSVDEEVREAFIKQFHKPALRVLSTKIARLIGLFDALLRRVNR